MLQQKGPLKKLLPVCIKVTKVKMWRKGHQHCFSPEFAVEAKTIDVCTKGGNQDSVCCDVLSTWYVCDPQPGDLKAVSRGQISDEARK